MAGITRRRLLCSTAAGLALAATSFAASAQFPSAVMVGGVTGNLSIQIAPARGGIATLTFINTSTTTAVPAGTPTPVFGWVFKDGDIPPGTAPVFSVGAQQQPFSAGLQEYWPSGCLKRCSFMLLTTSPTSPGGSLAVTLSGGGQWPYTAAQYKNPTPVSGRSLSDIYLQNLIVNAPLYPSANNGRGGQASVAAWLNGDANQWEAVKWLDGAAGTGWRISNHMAQTEGGTIDGMLAFTHYVIALNDGNGNLGGFRWLGPLRQPFYNQSGQANNAPGGYIWFAPPSTSNPAAGVNFSIQPPGAPSPIYTPMPWIGNDGNNFAPANFTTPTSGSPCTVNGGGVSNWDFRGAANFGGQFFGAAFSNLPNGFSVTQSGTGTNIENGGFCFLTTGMVDSTTNPDTTFELFSWPIRDGPHTYSFSGSTGGVSGTVTPCPVLNPFGRMFFCNEWADYFFFQGSGSLTADSTLHPQIDQSYWTSSRVIPPYNTAIVSNFVPDEYNNSGGNPNPWYPFCTGFANLDWPGVGDHPDIGILPWLAQNDFATQTWGTLYYNRIYALSCSTFYADFLDFPTKQRLNLANPATNYGLAAPSSQSITYINSAPGDNSGYPNPETLALGGFAYQNGEHEPAPPVWAFLRDGGLHLLDCVVDQAVDTLLSAGSGRTQGSSTVGITPTQYGCVSMGQREMRAYTWNMRNIVWAANLYPFDPSNNSANPVFSDGSNLGQYFVDCRTATMLAPLLQFQQVTTNSFWQANGIWFPYVTSTFDNNQPGWGVNCPQYQLSMLTSLYCLAMAHGDPNAETFLNDCLFPEWGKALTDIGGYQMYGDVARPWFLALNGTTWADTINTNGYILAGGLVTADNQVMANGLDLISSPGNNVGGSITWSPNNSGGTYTSQAFLLTVANTAKFGPSGTVRFANGDTMMNAPLFGATAAIVQVPELTAFLEYDMINVEYQGANLAFDLSSDGVNPILINSTSPASSYMGVRFRCAYKSPTQCTTGDAYPPQAWFWAAWANALGLNVGNTGNTATIIGDIYNRMINGTLPTGAYSSSDGRYAIQDVYSRSLAPLEVAVTPAAYTASPGSVPAAGTTISQASVTGGDGNPVTFSVGGSSPDPNLAINPSTGTITSKGDAAVEGNTYSTTVQATQP